MNFKEILGQGFKREFKVEIMFKNQGIEVEIGSNINVSTEDGTKIKDILLVSFFRQIGLEEEFIKDFMENDLKTESTVRTEKRGGKN